MKKSIVLIFIIGLILTFVLVKKIVFLDFFTSLVPRWHTTIYPTWMSISLVAIVGGLIIYVGYKFVKSR